MDAQNERVRQTEVSDIRRSFDGTKVADNKPSDANVGKEDLQFHRIFPKSGTKTFLKRLKGWQEILKNFLSYVEAVVSSEKKRYTDSARLGNEYLGFLGGEAGKNGEDETIFSAFEMHQVIIKCLLDSELQLNYNFMASLDSIEKNVIRGLKSLLQEVRKKCQESEKEWFGFDNELKKDACTYNKLKSELKSANEYFSSLKADRATKHAPQDPHVVYINLRNHVVSCLMKREKYCDLVLEQQASFFGYEIDTILKPFYMCVTSFFQWRGSCNALAQDIYKKLLRMLDNPDYEKSWDAFVSSNREYLKEHSIKPQGSKSKELMEDVDALVIPPCSKVIYQAKILKRPPQHFFATKPTYKEYLGITTSASYLHLYSPELEGNPNIINSAAPELSIYLNDCTILPLSSDSSSRQTEMFSIIERSSSLFAREVRHRFSSSDPSETKKWHKILCSVIKTSLRLSTSAPSPKSPQLPTSDAGEYTGDTPNIPTISSARKAHISQREAPSLIESLSQRSNSVEIYPDRENGKKKTSKFANFSTLKPHDAPMEASHREMSPSKSSPQYAEGTLGSDTTHAHIEYPIDQFAEANSHAAGLHNAHSQEGKYNVSESYEEQTPKYNVDELVEPNPWGGSSCAMKDTLN